MIIGYNIWSDDATYSGGAWQVALSNLTDPVVSVKARSSDTTTASTQYNVALVTSQSVKLIAITHTNLSASAQYKITWYSDAFSTAVDTTGWLSIPGYPSYDPDLIGASIFHIFDDALSYRYWKIELDDTSNADGYVEIGRNIICDVWAPPKNPDVGMSEALTPNTAQQQSMGGTIYSIRRKPFRSIDFGFSGVDTDVDLPALRKLRSIAGVDKQVVCIPDEDDTANYNYRCFVGTLSNLPTIAHLAAGYADGTGFTITEVV